MDCRSKKATLTFFDQPNVVRRPANRTASTYTPVLAAFDPYNAVIWANDLLMTIVTRNQLTQHELCDEDTETLAHEFARVLPFRDIFEDYLSHGDRVAALRRRRSRLVTRSTSESYANRRLFEERQAEEIVQRIRMEILNSFDRSQHGSGFAIGRIDAKAEEMAADMVRSLQDEYRLSARKEFVRLNALRDATPETGNGGQDGPPDWSGTRLRVRSIRWLFPTRLSPTLTDLVDEIASFEIEIVIPDSIKDQHLPSLTHFDRL